MNLQILKAASTTNVNKLSTAIIGYINQGKSVRIQAVGAAAVNQATKSVIAASRIYGRSIWMRPSFIDSEGKEKHICIDFELDIID